MDVAIVATKKTKSISRLAEAFKRQGFSKAEFVNAKLLTLLSKGGKTFAASGKNDLLRFDSVLLLLDLELAQFAEPLVEELEKQSIFCNVHPDAYYFYANEILQVVELARAGCKTTRGISGAGVESIRGSVWRLHYPVVFKSFSGNKKTQTIIIESERSLVSILKSIKVPLDGVLVKEMIDADLVECAVIGNAVFGLLRRWNGVEIATLAKSRPAVLTDWEKERALLAARALRCNIATVKMSKGFVTGVRPKIEFSEFNQKLGIDLYDETARYYRSMLEGKIEPKPKGSSLLDGVVKKLGDFFYARK